MLSIKNLHVHSGDTEILNGINLTIRRGETHFLMGPNGAGKSTLGLVLMGHPEYRVTKGTIIFKRRSLTGLSPDERAKCGLLLAFQHPLEFEGIGAASFLRASLVKLAGVQVSTLEIRDRLVASLKSLGMKGEFADRYLNWGFSGGERKKMEALQLSFICKWFEKPKLLILDEIDSGLDIDSLRFVARTINRLRKGNDISFLIITHTSRIVRYLKPNYVHILIDGKISKNGDIKLIHAIEKQGYKNTKA